MVWVSYGSARVTPGIDYNDTVTTNGDDAGGNELS